jgi:predicted transcriptional regulator
MNGGHTGGSTVSYTKTAVSLPDELFKRLEAFAASEGSPRSAVVAQALARFFELIDAGEFTRRMNEAWDSLAGEESKDAAAVGERAATETHLRLLAEESEPWAR